MTSSHMRAGQDLEGNPREGNPAPWLILVGLGEDGIAGLSEAAREAIATARLVVGGTRHLALVRALITGDTLAWGSPIDDAYPKILARRGERVVVLASGDPFFYGVGKQLAERVPAAEIISYPQPSAISLAASRMGWALQDTAVVTLHGRPLETIIGALQPGRRIIALSWDGTTPQKLKALLGERGFGASRLTVLEAMGGPNERRIDTTFDALAGDATFAPLNTLAIEIIASRNACVLPLTSGLDDALFESDGQLTKHEIRAVTMAALAPRYGELLWDIGLGAGSIAIEWLRMDASLSAIGIEERPDRAARARRNANALGVPRLEIVEGMAPAALAGLPTPDAVFIGGGLSEAGVFEAAWAALKPGGRLVANAVTLESEARLADLYKQHGGTLLRLAVDRLEPVGKLHGWRAAMPVTQWRVSKS